MIDINEFTIKAIEKKFNDEIKIEAHYIKKLQERVEYGMQLKYKHQTIYFGGYIYSNNYFKIESIVKNISKEIEKYEELLKVEYSPEHYRYLEKVSRVKREHFEKDTVDVSMFKFDKMFEKEVSNILRDNIELKNNFKELYKKTIKQTTAKELFRKLVLQSKK